MRGADASLSRLRRKQKRLKPFYEYRNRDSKPVGQGERRSLVMREAKSSGYRLRPIRVRATLPLSIRVRRPVL